MEEEASRRNIKSTATGHAAARDGAVLGICVGDTDGGDVGDDENGASVGMVVGADEDGLRVGDMVGSDMVGVLVGDTVGADEVGEIVGDTVGVEEVGEPVGDSVGWAVVGDADGLTVVGAWEGSPSRRLAAMVQMRDAVRFTAPASCANPSIRLVNASAGVDAQD